MLYRKTGEETGFVFMNVAISLEHRFYRTPDGVIWTDGLNAYSFWARYLTVFNGVKVIARVRRATSAGPGYRRADGPGVRFHAVPDYLGPWQYLVRALPVRRAVREAVERTDAVIMRVSSQIGACLEPWLTRHDHPYGLEVVTDPYDVFAPGSVDIPAPAALPILVHPSIASSVPQGDRGCLRDGEGAPKTVPVRRFLNGNVGRGDCGRHDTGSASRLHDALFQCRTAQRRRRADPANYVRASQAAANHNRFPGSNV